MTDDAFHLTPLDVRRFEFPSALRGYDRARVDAFRNQVADEMERLTRQIQDIESRAKGFHEQLRAFRERDKALNDALVSAQQLRGEMKEQAEKEAELIIRQAQADADRIIDAARGETRNITASMESLERSRRAYLMQLKALTERQLAEIEAAHSVSFIPRITPAGQDQLATDNSDSPPPHATPVWLKSLVQE
jgi:DivIVA domain-containing protein